MQKTSAGKTEFFRSGDSETVQAAVDFLGSRGGTVVVPRWNPRTQKAEWRFKRPVVLKSNVTVLLENALLIQETDCFSHLFETEEGAENVSLIGEGCACLFGGETSRLTVTTSGQYGLPDIENNAMCYFKGARGLTVCGLEILDPHWFAFVLDGTEDVSVKNIRFISYPLVPEEGGILIKNGCRNISVENLTGRTGFHSVKISEEEEGEISDIRIRNVVTDPTRGSLVDLKTGENGKIRDVRMSVLMDSSDFYEKARSGSALCFGEFRKPVSADCPASVISSVYAENLYSRAVNAIELLQPFSDTKVRNLMTFGDNITAVGSRSTKAFQVSNVCFDGVYYGAGSKPNNSDSFISRMAKGAKPVNTGKVTGYTVEHLFLKEEE